MSWNDPKWKYVPVKAMKPGYLAEKFKKIQRELEANRKEAEAKVKSINKRIA